MKSRLSVAGLTVAAGERRLLHGAEFELAPAERVSVQGPSGCGKTTLLRVIAGLTDAPAGRITLDDRDADDLGWPRWRRRVVYVAQQAVLFAGSVHDNLQRAFRYRSATGDLSGREAIGWLERLGLPASVLEQDASSLSVGEQQRVALIRALAVEPDVVLLDEPTSALDEASRDAVEDLLRQRGDEGGLAAVVVSHSPAQSSRLCHRTLDLPWSMSHA